jgi:hypothetical protein
MPPKTMLLDLFYLIFRQNFQKFEDDLSIFRRQGKIVLYANSLFLH